MSEKLHVLHAPEDVDLVGHVVDFLEAAFPSCKLSCSSFAGYRADPHRSLLEADAVVAVISRGALLAATVPFELGIARSLGKPAIIIADDTADPTRLCLPLSAEHVALAETEESLVAVGRRLAATLGLPFGSGDFNRDPDLTPAPLDDKFVTPGAAFAHLAAEQRLRDATSEGKAANDGTLPGFHVSRAAGHTTPVPPAATPGDAPPSGKRLGLSPTTLTSYSTARNERPQPGDRAEPKERPTLRSAPSLSRPAQATPPMRPPLRLSTPPTPPRSTPIPPQPSGAATSRSPSRTPALAEALSRLQRATPPAAHPSSIAGTEATLGARSGTQASPRSFAPATLPTELECLEAGRALGECLFHRNDGPANAAELDPTLGVFLTKLGVDWSRLRSHNDLELWQRTAREKLDRKPSAGAALRAWYELGADLATLFGLSTREDVTESEPQVARWQAAMAGLTARANVLKWSAAQVAIIEGMLENLRGPSAERDYTYVSRIQSSVRDIACADASATPAAHSL